MKILYNNFIIINHYECQNANISKCIRDTQIDYAESNKNLNNY